jgi:aspartyl-tRNA(Asn)/glutamyl-tRNA(Gln) amidotransferase subunit A
MSGELHEMGVVALAKALADRKVSAVETAQVFLGRMKAHESLGTFVDVNEEITLAQARAADAQLAAGNAPALAGVPIAHKDIFVTTDFATTAGSKMLAGYRSPFDAPWCAAWPRPARSRSAS